jgi:hypothetical protein
MTPRVKPDHAGRPPGARPHRDPTSLSSWGLAIARALEARKVAAPPLFARAGLDFAKVEDPDARYPVSATAHLWKLAVEATGDPAFGLEVARHTTMMTFHALGFSLAASGSVREAFDRMVRYYRLVSDIATIRFEQRGDAYRVEIFTEPSIHPGLEAIDALVAVAVRLCRSLADRGFAPLAVELRRPVPTDVAPYHRYFKARSPSARPPTRSCSRGTAATRASRAPTRRSRARTTWSRRMPSLAGTGRASRTASASSSPTACRRERLHKTKWRARSE